MRRNLTASYKKIVFALIALVYRIILDMNECTSLDLSDLNTDPLQIAIKYGGNDR